MHPNADTPASFPLPLPTEQRCPFAPAPVPIPRNGHASIPRVLCPSGIEAWLVAGYDDTRDVLGAPEHFSNRCGTGAHVLTHTPPDAPLQDGEFVRMDGLPHRRFRRLIGPELSAVAVEQLRPEVVRIIDEQVNELADAGGPIDLCGQFAWPVATSAIGMAFGLPREVRAVVSQAAVAFDADATAKQMVTAQMPLFEHLYGRILDPGAASGGDPLSRIVARAQQDVEPFTPAELVAAATIMIVAGLEATATAISNALLTLFLHPDQAAALRGDPGSTAAGVEELLRYTGVNTGLLRVTTKDTEIAGQRVSEGDFVLLLPHTASWDPSRFPDPGVLDMTRRPNPHLVFGYGPHVCSGQHLARMILQTVLSIVLRRMSTLRLAVPLDQITFSTQATTRGPVALPVVWDAVLDPSTRQIT